MLRVLKKATKKIGKLLSRKKKKEDIVENWVPVKKTKTKNQRRIETRKCKKRKRIASGRRKKARRRIKI